MNDLEVIAAKNAAKNQRQSKVVFKDDDDADRLPSSASSSPTAASLTATTPLAAVPPQEEKENPPGSRDDLSLTDDDDVLSDVSRPKKKKRWPFSYLFRPSHLKGSASTPSPLPPTPILSPDNGSSTTTLTPSELQEEEEEEEEKDEVSEEEEGYWAFKYPTLIPVTPAIWIKFDMKNQKQITHHVKSCRLDGIQLMDSHIYNGNVPFLVVPSQQCCYVILDLATSQHSCLEIAYTPF